MRRTLVLLALPLGLLALWSITSTSDRESAAEVEIVTDEVMSLRGAVIARMTSVGGVRVGEQTDYSGRGASELNFRVPAARLEETLVELGQVGGRITSQQINLTLATESSDRVGRDLADLDRCLADLATVVQRQDTGAATADLGSCQRRLDAVNAAVTTGDIGVKDALLRVRISPASTTNGLLVAAVGVIAVALALMTFLTLRSIREERTIDLSEDEPAGDYLFDRHWN